MPDIYQYIGNDISTGPTGDLLPVSGTVQGQQRVLRRLLTNQGEYVWHPTYGASLASYIGQPATTGEIQGVIQQQMLLEAAVAQTPAPQVTVSFYPDGTFFVSILYNDADTGQPVTLSFDVNS